LTGAVQIPGLGSRFRNSEVLADLGSEVIVEFSMPGNRRYLSLGAVHEDGVGAAFTKKLTAVLLEMTE
jgi:hypothetical protein